jgi:DNA-binding transcriptional MerR regulator
VSRYRIRTVAELTGVSTATLRAWERRYGVPAPARTASAYRLYSDADVAIITQMRDLVESGIAPAEAARLLRERSGGKEESPTSLDAYQMACDRLVEAALRFDVEALREEAGRALTLGPAVSIFDRTLAPALVKIGDLWSEGQLTVAQEHLASNILLGRVSQLLELLQPLDSSRSVALACFEEEEHVVGLYGAGLHFAAWGYRSVFLGARTPPDAVARVVSTLHVDAVALSVTIAPQPARAQSLILAYAGACNGAPLIVGGQGSSALGKLVEAIGGVSAHNGFSELRKIVDKAARGKRKAPELSPN